MLDFKLKCGVYIPLKQVLQNEKDHLLSPCPYAVVLDNCKIDLKVFKYSIH